MPAKKKVEPQVAPSVSQTQGAGVAAQPNTPDAPTPWPAVLGVLGALPAAAWAGWEAILAENGLVLLYSEPVRGQVTYTLLAPGEGGGQWAWSLWGNVAPDLALARLFCKRVVEIDSPPATQERIKPQPAPELEPEEEEDLTLLPARAATLVLANKLADHEMLSPKQRQHARKFLDRTEITEGQALSCIKALEEQIDKALEA